VSLPIGKKYEYDIGRRFFHETKKIFQDVKRKADEATLSFHPARIGNNIQRALMLG